MAIRVGEIRVSASKLAHGIAEFVRDTELPLLFHDSNRVFYWAALTGARRNLVFDAELLYAGAMFHDMGLTHRHSSHDERFGVDGANAAREFLRDHGVPRQNADSVWTVIALHTTPGIPQHMHPVIALLTAGVEMDVLGIAYAEFSDAEREAVVRAHPRNSRFKEEIIRPSTTVSGISGRPRSATSRPTYSRTRTHISRRSTSAALSAAHPDSADRASLRISLP